MKSLDRELSQEFRAFLEAGLHPALRDELDERELARPKVVCVVVPGVGVIDNDQAAQLQSMVRSIVRTHGAPYQSVWTLLNEHTGAAGYRLTKPDKFGAAVAFLEHWQRTGLPKV